MSKKLLLFCLILHKLSLGFTQIPFECGDGPFLTFNRAIHVPDDDFSNLSFFVYPENTDGDFFPFPLGYNTVDNLLYSIKAVGFGTGMQELLIFDKTGQTIEVIPLSLDENYYHVGSGEFKPGTETFYYLNPLADNISDRSTISKLDINNLSSIEVIPLETTGGAERKFTGFAFDNLNPRFAFSFNFLEETKEWVLVKIDTETGIVQDDLFPPFTVPNEILSLTGLFHDAYNNLFVIGTGADLTGCQPCYGIYHVNKSTGQITEMGLDPDIVTVVASDVCNCPYVPGLQLHIQPEQTYPCSDAVFTYQFYYNQPEDQERIILTDTLPTGFVFKEIIDNPFGGNVTGLGTNMLTISDMFMGSAFGTDSLQIIVSIPEDAIGDYENQAYIQGFNSEFVAGETALFPSDNPATPERAKDPTPFTVLELELDNIESDYFICPDSSLTLSPIGNGAGFDFMWSTGSSNPSISVETAGTYGLTLSNNCESIEVPIIVNDAGVLVDIGDNIILPLGDELNLSAEVSTIGQEVEYLWSASVEDSIFSCTSCLETNLLPSQDLQITFLAENEYGCTGLDLIGLKVRTDIYLPNAFSPDLDGINDVFFPKSKNDYQILTFQIYDRWGGLLYDKKDLTTNDYAEGWDGMFSGSPLDKGVYVYFLEVIAGNKSILLKGDVTLLR